MSSDLRQHSVAKFVLPLFEHYDREKFEIIAYSPFERPDHIQLMIKELITEFKVTQDMSEYEIAQIIREDEIDVLFELNGFTRDNRLRVFPYKAAPIQIFWLGYPFTTGIPEVDYLLLDPYVKPVDEGTLIEKPLVMPESWVCFGEFDDEPINPVLPLERNGYVTFGSLNNPYKLTRKTIAQWAEIMNRVPDSRFLYVRSECKSMILCNNLISEFGSHGIGPERLHFVNNTGMPISHLSFYDEMDISLDPFPLTGGTTTCDSLWMGVPVISKVGAAMHQRLSYSLMTSVGLQELCVETDEDYIEKAVALANEPEALQLLRQELRPTIQNSALCRSEDFARNFCDLMTEVVQRHGVR
jgi:predicted O-linked N-acetylglucosamine transferase (SPINDLY family)